MVQQYSLAADTEEELQHVTEDQSTAANSHISDITFLSNMQREFLLLEAARFFLCICKWPGRILGRIYARNTLKLGNVVLVVERRRDTHVFIHP